MVYRPLYNPSTSSPDANQWRLSPWATYTPTWTNAGGAPTVGNSTLRGRYRREGTTLFLQVRLDVGSSGVTVGSGAIRLSLPSGMVGAPIQQVGGALFFDASAGTNTRGVGLIDGGGTYIYPYFNDGTTASDAAGLAATDVIACGGVFEIEP